MVSNSRVRTGSRHLQFSTPPHGNTLGTPPPVYNLTAGMIKLKVGDQEQNTQSKPRERCSSLHHAPHSTTRSLLKMGQACSAGESRRRKLGYGTGVLLHDPSVAIRAGARVRVSDRQIPYVARECEVQETERQINAAIALEDGSTTRGLFGSGDEEDVQFLDAVKGLIDGAVKLASAEKGVGTRIMSGLLLKTGIVDSFVDNMVEFVNRRLLILTESLSPKDVAIAAAVSLRKHVQAHDKITEALGIRAGRRKRTRKKGKTTNRRYVQEDAARDIEEGSEAGEYGEDNSVREESDDEREEDEVEVVQLWREWKRSGGFWPEQMPNPTHSTFEGKSGSEAFMSKLDDGIEAFLQDLAKHLLQTALPEDAEEVRQAVGAANSPAASGTTSRSGADKKATGKAAVETANRLAQLKSAVLEPMLVQILQQQVIKRCRESPKLWQILLRLFRPNAQVDSLGHDLKHPETFSLMSQALERLGKGQDSSLRMELMQGLVKMTWGNADEHSSSSSRALPALSGAGSSPGIPNDGSHLSSSQRSVTSREDRLGSSGSGFDWSEIGSDYGGGDSSAGLSAPSTPRSVSSSSTTPRGTGTAGGARDLFEIPYKEQLSQGLVGGKKDKFYEELESRALKELEEAWEAEVTTRFPLAKCVFPTTWVMDRISAARALARRPTNLMLALSILDAAKDVLRGASDHGKKRAKTARNTEDSAGSERRRGEVEEKTVDGSRSTDTDKLTRERQPARREGDVSERGLARIPRNRVGVNKNTPGWRAWETRREWFFGSDLSYVSTHFGRSLLGEETMNFANVILKAFSLEYNSVENIIRHETLTTIQKLSQVGSADVIKSVKPVTTQPILYVSSQMRMLRALKKTGLDFSKTFGDGPQKTALSRRFRSYCWIFTDSLIEKLVAIKTKERARDRALVSSAVVPSNVAGGDAAISREGEGFSSTVQDSKSGDSDTGMVVVTVNTGDSLRESEMGKSRTKELKREKTELKVDVMREMTSFSSSKDLLKQIITTWLPRVFNAEREENIYCGERDGHTWTVGCSRRNGSRLKQ